ncbi:MAG: NifB/NifX family molybdenum-iron cluster-binding protein [Clostridia bacterium]|nr:NifB/NifX family molybdenum-iron cluster-binding protein [Clostridia bacterium]
MKVAVTYDQDEMIFQHFGHTERFKLYELENGEVVSEEIADTGDAGHEALAAFLVQRGVDTLICGGIGAGAIAALGMAGIRVYGGITGLADAAVEALSRGVLAYNPAPNCDHHDGEHDCHEHGGEHGGEHSCGCHGEDGGACGCGN